MKMKKIVAVLLSIIMVLILTMTALADNELRIFYDSVTNLLFETIGVVSYNEEGIKLI